MLKRNIKTRFNEVSNSAKWTALFAFIAIVSILAIGFKPVSYALNTDPSPPSFTIDEVELGSQIIRGGLGVFPYTANSGAFQVYCLEVDKTACDITTDEVYTKGPSQDSDYGLNYILRNSYPNVNDGSPVDDQIWVTQIAIWEYLDATLFATVKTPIVISASRAAFPDLWAKVDSMVSRAHAATDPVNQLSFDINTEFAITADGKYYLSNLVTTTGLPADIFQKFDIILDGAPEGTEILDASSQPMSSLTGLAPNTKFYVRVPVDSITPNSEQFVVGVKGYFLHFRSWRYSSADGDCQSVVLVEPVIETMERTVPIILPVKVPDTAESSGLGIYFIGAIILLSGAGIIYANVKPKSKK